MRRRILWKFSSDFLPHNPKNVILQEQLAQLALAMLQERERSVEHRISVLAPLMHPPVGRHMLLDPSEPACVLISSQEGELLLTPDAAEWFEWLPSISSFRGKAFDSPSRLMGSGRLAGIPAMADTSVPTRTGGVCSGYGRRKRHPIPFK
jgi:hypothetical protein